jgi:hypothetical protein
MRQRTLGDAFGFERSSTALVSCRDAIGGLEHLHREADLAERGLHLELGAYRCHVFLDWRVIADDGGRPWRELCGELAGRGVPSLADAVRELELRPIHGALGALLDFAQELPLAAPDAPTSAVLERALERGGALIEAVRVEAERSGVAAGMAEFGRALGGDRNEPLQRFRRRLLATIRLAQHRARDGWPIESGAALPGAGDPPDARPWVGAVAFAALECLGRAADPGVPDRAATRLFDHLGLREPLAAGFAAAGASPEERWRRAAWVRAAFAHARPTSPDGRGAPASELAGWLDDPDVAWALGVHEHAGVRYVVKEHFEQFEAWMALRGLLEASASPDLDVAAVERIAATWIERFSAAERAGYRVDRLIAPQPAGTARR